MLNSESLHVLQIIQRTALAYGKNEVGIPGIDSRVLARHPNIVLEGRLAGCLQSLEDEKFISKVAAYAYGITESGRHFLEETDRVKPVF